MGVRDNPSVDDSLDEVLQRCNYRLDHGEPMHEADVRLLMYVVGQARLTYGDLNNYALAAGEQAHVGAIDARRHLRNVLERNRP